jgi:hypothetical protein
VVIIVPSPCGYGNFTRSPIFAAPPEPYIEVS